MSPSVGRLLVCTFAALVEPVPTAARSAPAHAAQPIEPARSDRPVIGMTNLGVLTNGATRAVERFRERGYEVIVFHAVGSGGCAMEQMMKDGLIGAVFDDALGEISDDVRGPLRPAPGSLPWRHRARDLHAEDPAFADEAVDRLVRMIEEG